MRSSLDRFRLPSAISLAALIFVFGAIAQPKKPQGDQKKNPSQAGTEKTEQQDIPIRLDTDLVTAPNCARRLILRSRDRGRSFTTRSNSR